MNDRMHTVLSVCFCFFLSLSLSVCHSLPVSVRYMWVAWLHLKVQRLRRQMMRRLAAKERGDADGL